MGDLSNGLPAQDGTPMYFLAQLNLGLIAFLVRRGLGAKSWGALVALSTVLIIPTALATSPIEVLASCAVTSVFIGIAFVQIIVAYRVWERQEREAILREHAAGLLSAEIWFFGGVPIGFVRDPWGYVWTEEEDATTLYDAVEVGPTLVAE